MSEGKRPSCGTCRNWCDRCLCPMRNDAGPMSVAVDGPTVVVAAAVEQDGVVYAVKQPARHHNVMAMMHFRFGIKLTSEVQGFMLSNGRFADREESLVAARTAGQVDKIIGGCLTSEDLW